MAVGLASTAYVNKVLNHMHGAVASTAPAGNFIKLHTNVGDPGAAGTANPSSVTTRVAATFSSAAAPTIAMNNTPSWPSWAGSAETIAHISGWDVVGPAGGTFLYSASLTTPKAVAPGDTLTLTSFSVSLAPLAA